MIKIFSATLLLLSLNLSAAFKGSISFTQEEITEHKLQVENISDGAAACLHATWNKHEAFFKKYKVSKYYGDRNPNLSSREKRRKALIAAKIPKKLHEEILNQQEPISCIGLARMCLGNAFKAAGDISTKSWFKIDEFAKLNALDGSAVIEALRLLGWQVLYWNPDIASNAKWDAEDNILQGAANHPAKGYHSYRYTIMKKTGKYYDNYVTDQKTLTNFGADEPEVLNDYNFFFAVAHTGYHVFPGTFGQVIEAHSMRSINDPTNLENAPFNPLGNGGAPKWTATLKYRSGILAVPPKQ
jgi:hypothetical protein